MGQVASFISGHGIGVTMRANRNEPAKNKTQTNKYRRHSLIRRWCVAIRERERVYETLTIIAKQ